MVVRLPCSLPAAVVKPLCPCHTSAPPGFFLVCLFVSVYSCSSLQTFVQVVLRCRSYDIGRQKDTQRYEVPLLYVLSTFFLIICVCFLKRSHIRRFLLAGYFHSGALRRPQLVAPCGYSPVDALTSTALSITTTFYSEDRVYVNANEYKYNSMLLHYLQQLFVVQQYHTCSSSFLSSRKFLNFLKKSTRSIYF